MGSLRWVWISPRWPFPADDGAKRATASLLAGLAERGHAVHVLSFAREAVLAPSTEPAVSLLAHRPAPTLTRAARLLSAMRNLASDLPVTAAPFARLGESWASLRAILPGEPDAVVFDGCHGYAGFRAEICPWPMVYRAHNVEHALWRAAGARSWLRPYFSLQANRMRRLEGELASRASGIAAISPEDADSFRALAPRTPVAWVPVGFPVPEARPFPAMPLTIGFLGSMDWPPNRDGLSWFLKEVWPAARARRPELRLRIAGSGAAAWLEPYLGAGIEWLGRVGEVGEFYAGLHVALVPIRYGGGTKIKLVESACHGRAIFTTIAGHRGSGLPATSMALLADDAGAWVDALASADPTSLAARGDAARREAIGLFGLSATTDRFLSLVNKKY